MSTALADTTTLAELADRINREHAACEAAVRSGLDHALEAGRLLIEAKGRCLHGTWSQWLADNFHGSERTAQAYIRVAKRWPEIEAKAQRSADLSLDGALKLLASPRGTAGSREPERPDWSRREVNERIAKRWSLERCFGHLLNWAKENGVEEVHRLGWLCPAQGWMNDERQLDLILSLGSDDAPSCCGPFDDRRRSCGEAICEVASYYSSIPTVDAVLGPGPVSGFPIVCMCDVAIGRSKLGRDAAPDDKPVRIAPCGDFREACVFGTRPDMKRVRVVERALDKWLAGEGPAPFPWIEDWLETGKS